MPRAPRYCPSDGCMATLRPGQRYCPEHTPIGWSPRGAERTGTAAHKRWRLAVLERAGWQCEIRGPRCQGRATDADHKIPLSQGGAEYDVDNGQAACTTCHRQKTSREAAEGRRRQQGWGGPPGAGE